MPDEQQIMQYLLENIDSESPGETSLAHGSCQGVMYFIVDTDKVYDCVKSILGYTKYDNRVFAAPEINYAGLRRTIPMSMPGGFTTPLYANRIGIQYFNPNGKNELDKNEILINQFSTNEPAKAVSVKSFPYYGEYTKARLAVSFQAVNYFVLTDDQLDNLTYSNGQPKYKYEYYTKRIVPVGNKGYPVSTPVNWFDFLEYLRYVSVDISPNNDVVVMENGQMFWRTQPNDPIAGIPINNTAVGALNSSAIFQNITKNIVTMTWYQLPYSIIYNKQYAKYQGTINFGPNYDEEPENVDKWGYDLYKFKPGTLLYLGAEFVNKRNPFPILPYRNENEVSAYCSLIENTYVDVKFSFLQFDIPSEQLVLPNPNNIDRQFKGKMYTNGLNFAPLPITGFHYTESQPTPDKAFAICPYYSYAHQRLFCPQATD